VLDNRYSRILLLGLPVLALYGVPSYAQEIFTANQLLSQNTPGLQLDESLGDLKAASAALQEFEPPKDLGISAPAYTISNPSGYGLTFGSASLAAGFSTEPSEQEEGQAGLGFGIGLGDPDQWVGLDLTYTFGNLLDEGNGGLSAKIHRSLVSTDQVNLALAVGWEDFATTGDTPRVSSVYGVATAIFKLQPDIRASFSRLSVTLGVGGGRFRSEEDIRDGEESVNVFASGSLRIARSLSVIAEWTGQELSAGISWAPFKQYNFYITPSLRNLTADDSENVRFSLSTGVLIQF
jgi:hypothetical protein